MSAKRQRGFSITEGALVVVVIGLLGLLGVKAWDSWQNREIAKQATSSSQTTPPQEPSEVASATDLDSAVSYLDSTNLDNDELAQLDAETNF